MNLHNIAGPCVAAVNPWAGAQWFQSSGFTTDANYKPSPSYAAPVEVQVQMQPLSYKDLMQVNALNQNGEKRALYLNGNITGVMRADGTGGDLFVLDSDGSVWLVVIMLEHFYATSGWTKVAVVRQPNGSAP